MKLGLIAPYGLGTVEDGDFARAFARLAEEIGFESRWPVEHVVESLDYRSLSPHDRAGPLQPGGAPSARAAGHQPDRIEIACLGPAVPDAARGCAAEGVARRVVFPPGGDLGELRRALAPLTGA